MRFIFKLPKLVYNFIYYTIYRIYEKAITRWWSDWKTNLTLTFLWGSLLVIAALKLEEFIFIERFMSTPYPFVVLGVLIVVFHHYRYSHNKKYAKVFAEFKDMNKWMDIFGIIGVLLLIGSILWTLFRVIS